MAAMLQCSIIDEYGRAEGHRQSAVDGLPRRPDASILVVLDVLGRLEPGHIAFQCCLPERRSAHTDVEAAARCHDRRSACRRDL
jgi:hypothetical protein